MTDPLPENTAIWICKIAGPPGLGFYRYSGFVPKAWEPIFGTAGTSNALSWNGMMFHPGVTAPPGTNALTATFEAFLVNSDTGQELPGSGSGPLVFNWTNVSDGRPALDIGIKLVVAWPALASDYVLESADSVAAAVWNKQLTWGRALAPQLGSDTMTWTNLLRGVYHCPSDHRTTPWSYGLNVYFEYFKTICNPPRKVD